MAAVYDQHRLGDAPGSMLFPDDILAVLVEQIFAAHRSEKHSPGSAITHTAWDLGRLAQGSKALHTTVMAAWQHLYRVLDRQLELATEASAAVAAQLRQPPFIVPADYHANQCLLRTRLPEVADLDWVSPPSRACQAFGCQCFPGAIICVICLPHACISLLAGGRSVHSPLPPHARSAPHAGSPEGTYNVHMRSAVLVLRPGSYGSKQQALHGSNGVPLWLASDRQVANRQVQNCMSPIPWNVQDEVVANIEALRVVDMKAALKALGLKVSGAPHLLAPCQAAVVSVQPVSAMAATGHA